MNGDGLYPESSRSLDDLWQMRLLLLLNDMVDGMGKVKTAKALGVNYRTLDRAAKSGRLTERMSDALGRHLLLGGGSAAAQQRERVELLLRTGWTLLEKELRGGLEAVVGEVKVLREEHDQGDAARGAAAGGPGIGSHRGGDALSARHRA